MDFGDTPATQLTERIMLAIRGHLKDDAPGQLTSHYNAVYSHVHRHILADMLVAHLAAKGSA